MPDIVRDPAILKRKKLRHALYAAVGVLVVIGVSIGLVGSLIAARYVQTLLFQLDARDPATFAAAAAVLVLIGIAAAWIPAARAGRIDPATILRES